MGFFRPDVRGRPDLVEGYRGVRLALHEPRVEIGDRNDERLNAFLSVPREQRVVGG